MSDLPPLLRFIGPVARRCLSGLLLLTVFASLLGCRPQTAETSDVRAVVEFHPAPPMVGPTALAITLTTATGDPVRLGTLKVEGNMNHAGMRPVFTTLMESDPGRYVGTIEFTMGGDWFLLLSGDLPDGDVLNRKIEVPGVKSR